ncbi:MAG: metallophosphoesterase [Lachnospiraceae bacterium]|nr:metallophosphoesterase [Lachnospiraceae bacterium]
MAKYNILALADIHWGAMDPEEMYENLSLVLEFIKAKRDIDLVVICGDYFDYRLTLNSKAALMALRWFDDLYDTCIQCDVKRLRAIKGTKEHDNEQWEAIHPNETGDFFKKFYVNTIEETLPGLKCIYCPDETINLEDYVREYAANLVEICDIGFFHGNFNTQLPKMVIEQNLDAKIPSIIYFKDTWQSHIRGPMIAGHWHTFTDLDPLIYVGSFDRWAFGEEEDKGMLFVQYDTDDHSYFWKRIINPFARNFVTISVDSQLVSSPDDFADLRQTIEHLRATDNGIRIKVLYMLTSENDEAMMNFNQFRNVVSSMRGVKIDLKDLVRKNKRKQEKENVSITTDKYAYILDHPQEVITNVHEFLLREREVDIPVETIEEILGKYIVK